MTVLRPWLLLTCVLALALAGCQSPTPTPTPVSPVPTLSLPTPAAVPDGESILFVSVQNGVYDWYLMRSDGSELRRLEFSALEGRRAIGLNWIADLQSFVGILADVSGFEDLFLLDLQGNILSRMSNSTLGESDVHYSPSTGRFVYVCTELDLDICVVSPNGTNRANLTLFPSRDAAPSWSPDGSRILFISNRSAVPALWQMNPDGSDPAQLSPDSITPEGNPSWSPDGSLILFQSQRDYNWEIYVMDAGGGSARNLTNHVAEDTAPKWSPDGTHIAFRSDRDGTSNVFVMAADGSGVVNVTPVQDYDVVHYVWSPDSQQIVYVAPGGSATDIFIVNRDGSGRRNLTNSPDPVSDPQWVY